MGASAGPKIIKDNLILALDAANRLSTLRKTQSSNILVDPNTWVPGTGSSSGYNDNGGAAEQNRLSVNDDPWGRRSVTWRTTPDSSSGADGGWNTGYYPVDTNYTYRFSVWVRRYTSGTGGTFYLGMNPNPIQNDNNSEQGNPYFTYTSISNLTENQWYLVVGHCFFEGYNGGRHPNSGWYEKTTDGGVKISDKSFGNVGTEDVRWKPGTTTARHRAYHYYTTNVNSGIEFAFPRLDKCDESEPTIRELLETGESGWGGLTNNVIGNLYNGVGHTDDNFGAMTFDGSSDYISLPNSLDYTTEVSAFAWFKTNGSGAGGYHIIYGPSDLEISVNNSDFLRTGVETSSGRFVSNHGSGIVDGNWHHVGFTFSGTLKKSYIDSVLVGTQTVSGTLTSSFSNRHIGRFGSSNSYYLNGDISNTQIYNRALTEDEIKQNFEALRGRYGI